MAETALSVEQPRRHSKKERKRKKQIAEGEVESEAFESRNVLPWKKSLSNEDESFASLLIGGTSELEGGFFSLEELDESEYGVVIPEPSGSSESKKRKRQVSEGGSVEESEAGTEEKVEKNGGKKNAKKKKKKGRVSEVGSSNSSSSCISLQDEVVNTDEDAEKEAQFYAWNELRLHPSIMKSIYRLGFKEPTPIQKACIPAASHKGKDVIGAAETGSGKTLAFGLPILQRLLEEQEKAAKSDFMKGNLVEKDVRGSALRALIVTPTRELALQVSDHLKEVARFTNIRVVPIVGGMSTEKQERLLKAQPEIVVGTPGRLWELMSGGDCHLVELCSLSFFVLDEADRMIENGHFHELQSIIDMLPTTGGSVESNSLVTQNCVTVSNLQQKKRQTFVFSATIALSSDFRKKLKRGSLKSKQSMSNEMSSLETLSERAGMRADAAIFDLTSASILADKLEESFIECREEDKDAYLYYLLSVHGQGRTIVFCTSIAALRHISSLLRILGVNVWPLHAQMQQRARLKAIDRFRENEHGTLIATDVAARGLDIPGVRTVVHYQLPHSADVYVHRSGRTARASADGCCIALISSSDRMKFASLCKSFSKEKLQRFPVDDSYMAGVIKRLSLARQIDKIVRKDSQEKAKKSWFERNAESVELLVEDDNSEEERVNSYKQKRKCSLQLKELQQDLNSLLSCPLQPNQFSHRFLAGTGVSPSLQHQFEELVRQKRGENSSREGKQRKIVVIGQDCVEPLEALRGAGREDLDLKQMAEKQTKVENLRRRRKEEKKHLHDKRRKERKRLKKNIE